MVKRAVIGGRKGAEMNALLRKASKASAGFALYDPRIVNSFSPKELNMLKGYLLRNKAKHEINEVKGAELTDEFLKLKSSELYEKSLLSDERRLRYRFVEMLLKDRGIIK